MSTQITSNQIQFAYLPLSGPNQKNHFALGHSVSTYLVLVPTRIGQKSFFKKTDTASYIQEELENGN